MWYTKPNLQSYPALRAIQSGGQSKRTGNLETDQVHFTAAAYEADE
jgi:hypothetical protein